MTVHLQTAPDVATAYLVGELDHHGAGKIRNIIDSTVMRMEQPPKVLYLDFGDVGFMDSSGIGLVMGRYRLMTELGGRVEVTNLSPKLRKVMLMAGLEKLGVLEKEGIQKNESFKQHENGF